MGAKPSPTPLPKSLKFQDHSAALLSDPEAYKRLIESPRSHHCRPTHPRSPSIIVLQSPSSAPHCSPSHRICGSCTGQNYCKVETERIVGKLLWRLDAFLYS
ncbi:Uncharacterized protein Fot_24750 [Forsythia ovata]|uniref:Uncharacterized protein n=1 Tax=Forsythia ovata TaxID=205694 RepID=A0ABD1U749_9LAMI